MYLLPIPPLFVLVGLLVLFLRGSSKIIFNVWRVSSTSGSARILQTASTLLLRSRGENRGLRGYLVFQFLGAGLQSFDSQSLLFRCRPFDVHRKILPEALEIASMGLRSLIAE